MTQEQFSMQRHFPRVNIANVSAYLLATGWQRKASPYEKRIYFEGQVHDGGSPYQLYLPASDEVPKYRTLLQRAIYYLCGVEDREPNEVILDILNVSEQPLPNVTVDRPNLQVVRVRNTSDSPLRLRLETRQREHELHPGESIELRCQASSPCLEIEYGNEVVVIHEPSDEGSDQR